MFVWKRSALKQSVSLSIWDDEMRPFHLINHYTFGNLANISGWGRWIITFVEKIDLICCIVVGLLDLSSFISRQVTQIMSLSGFVMSFPHLWSIATSRHVYYMYMSTLYRIFAGINQKYLFINQIAAAASKSSSSKWSVGS